MTESDRPTGQVNIEKSQQQLISGLKFKYSNYPSSKDSLRSWSVCRIEGKVDNHSVVVEGRWPMNYSEPRFPRDIVTSTGFKGKVDGIPVQPEAAEGLWKKYMGIKTGILLKEDEELRKVREKKEAGEKEKKEKRRSAELAKISEPLKELQESPIDISRLKFIFRARIQGIGAISNDNFPGSYSPDAELIPEFYLSRKGSLKIKGRIGKNKIVLKAKQRDNHRYATFPRNAAALNEYGQVTGMLNGIPLDSQDALDFWRKFAIAKQEELARKEKDRIDKTKKVLTDERNKRTKRQREDQEAVAPAVAELLGKDSKSDLTQTK